MRRGASEEESQPGVAIGVRAGSSATASAVHPRHRSRLAEAEARAEGSRRALAAERRRLAQEAKRVLYRSAAAAAPGGADRERGGSATGADGASGGRSTAPWGAVSGGVSAWEATGAGEGEGPLGAAIAGVQEEPPRHEEQSHSPGLSVPATCHSQAASGHVERVGATAKPESSEESIRREIAQLRAEAAEHKERAQALAAGRRGPPTTAQRQAAQAELDGALRTRDAVAWVETAAAVAGVDEAAQCRRSIFRKPPEFRPKSATIARRAGLTETPVGVTAIRGTPGSVPDAVTILAGLGSPSSHGSPTGADWEQRVAAWQSGQPDDDGDSFDAMAAALLDRLHTATPLHSN